MAFTQIIVTATYKESDGVTPATGDVTFVATGAMRDTVTNVTISPTEILAVLDEDGQISVPLTATNGEFTTPKGITYEVTERINGAAQNKYFISINKDAVDGTVDLADLAPDIYRSITVNYATKEYVDTLLLTAEGLTFIPNDEILSTTVQTAIEEVRDISKYVHVQATASVLWDITHNLRFYPNVTIVDSGDNFVVGDVNYLSINRLQVTFAHSFGGKAYLS